MRVELDVDLRPTKPEPEKKPVADPEVVAEKRARGREEKFLRRIALAQIIEAKIADGTFVDLADTARRCDTSRARISRIVDYRPSPDNLNSSPTSCNVTKVNP